MAGRGQQPDLATELSRQRLARVRRRRFRRWWRDARAFIVMGGAIIAIGLAIWGFRDTAATGSADWSDTAYRAVRLFGAQGAEQSDPSWQLEVARILAPLLVGYVAIAGLLALYREQAQ